MGLEGGGGEFSKEGEGEGEGRRFHDVDAVTVKIELIIFRLILLMGHSCG